jgi:hypothetical protein
MICLSVTGNACIGQAPTCAQIKAGDKKFGVDNGELCDDSKGYWLAPEAGSTFPISISASVAHLKEDPAAAVKGPTSNNHWHPFCNTVDGVERIHTFDSGEDYGMDTAKIWAGARAKAGCADFPGALPTTGFTTPTTQCYSATGNRCSGPAPTCAQIKAADKKFGVDNGELCDDTGQYLYPDGRDFH